MGRPRTPSAVLELTGAFRKDPARGRARENEPEANGPVGAAPESFAENPKLLAIWDELTGLVPARVLARGDRWTVEVACRMMDRLRGGDFKAAELSILTQCLCRMGLTPADRSRIAISEEKDDTDELGELASESLGRRIN